MNRMNLLLIEFGWQTDIPLEQVSAKYLGISDKAKISIKARRGQLPFPAFRAGTGQKAPWMVNIVDLAEYLDKQHEKSKSDFQSLHA